ncbi:MAG: EamA family transporter, partial [Candidatus Thorarchaeota archaeon]|nr:EamA family transporter [Candidatus Thorarchaeota archaeon]
MQEEKNETRSSFRTYLMAVLLALVVTALWASSWIIIKFGLEEIPPITYAGLRYGLAAAILLGLILANKESRSIVMMQRRRWWIAVAGYGIIFVTVTQGTQFVSLSLLPAITVSLILNLTPIVVLLLSMGLLRERPSIDQIGFILLGVVGIIAYFYPKDLGEVALFGLIVTVVGLLANSLSAVVGRAINRNRTAPALVITGISMAFGAAILLVWGFVTEGVPTLSLISWTYIIWLSVVNTALAFTLWNKAMQHIRAVDMSLIQSTMMPQIVILSVIFLGEVPTILDWIALSLIAISVLLVQV